ncbi:MAG: M36 family metallopeptidase [Ferruginibacter sp.]
MYTINASKKMDKTRAVPARYFDFNNEPCSKSCEEIATQSIKEIANELQIPSDLSQLKFDTVKESIIGYHALYQQQLYNKPVSGSWIRVDIDRQGRIFNITNDLVPEWMHKYMDTGVPSITIEQAKSIALGAIDSTSNLPAKFFGEELVTFLKTGMLVTAWKLIFKTINPFGSWKMYIDANSGEILSKVNMLKHAVGRVFSPELIKRVLEVPPTVSLSVLDSEYLNVTLEGLEPTGNLDGIFVSTRLTENRASQLKSGFLFSRDDIGFKEVMAYYYIDQVQRYIQGLGFDNIMNKQIEVKVNGIEDDNSFYDSVEKYIMFGKGGVNDAEDAEIIVHEYAHALVEDILPGFGDNNNEAQAIEEGFCDYLAASFFEKNKPEPLKPTFGSWNAFALNNGNQPPCVRRLDSPKKFPHDMVGNAHKDCELWSACLWEIRAELGKEKADQLFIAHLRLLTKKSIFESAAELMITANKKLNNGEKEDFIKSVFIKRAILV